MSLTVWMMLVLTLGGMMSSEAGLITPQEAELRRYRFRVQILHQQLLDMNCSDVPALITQRQLTDSHQTEHQIEVEKILYKHFLDLIVACKKSNLAPKEPPQKTTKIALTTSTSSPTTPTPKTSSATTTPTTTTTVTPASTSTVTQTTTTTVVTPTSTTTMTPKKSTCRDGYVLNPFSSTCIRFVQLTGNWSQAKSACEEAGETLAVFPTEASARWVVSTLKDLENTPARWQSYYWIGLRGSDDGWRWQGRMTTSVSTTDHIWESGEPDRTNEGTCGCVTGIYSSTEKLNDCSCNINSLRYICETNSN